MPNHILNEVEIPLAPQAIMPLVCGDNGEIDFATLLPLPIHFWPGSVGSRHEATFPGTHLAAATATWGTKWNAYGLDSGRYRPIVAETARVILTFQTAWRPPMGWIMALWNTLKTDLTVRWLDEGRDAAVVDAFSYRILASDDGFGEPWVRAEADDATTRRLHKLLWGVEAFKADEGALNPGDPAA